MQIRQDLERVSIILVSTVLLAALQMNSATATPEAPLVINEVAYRGTQASSSDEYKVSEKARK